MKKNLSGWLKRGTAALLVMAMISSDVLPVIAADKKDANGLGITEEQLQKELAQGSEQYPDGGIEFYNTEITAKEGETNKQDLVIVRRGGLDKEASVDLKVVSVSAAYGEDYLLRVKEKLFFKRTLEGDSETLTEYNRQQAQEAEGDKQEQAAEATSDQNAEKKKDESEDANSAKEDATDAEAQEIDWTEVGTQTDSSGQMKN